MALILQLAAILGIVVSVYSNPNGCSDQYVYGCYWPAEQKIWINRESPNKINTLNHEVGHALLYKDKIAEDLVKSCTGLGDREIVADSFAKYIEGRGSLSINCPSLFIYFRDQIEKTLAQEIISGTLASTTENQKSLNITK